MSYPVCFPLPQHPPFKSSSRPVYGLYATTEIPRTHSSANGRANQCWGDEPGGGLVLRFIESLSPDRKLNISKGSLYSVTHDVVAYEVKNLSLCGYPVILLDTPGFLDSKMSESRITRMIVSSLDAICNSASSVRVSILYFQAITDTRIGGKRRESIELLKGVAATLGAVDLTVVTTMWNKISWSATRMKEAQERFENLRMNAYNSSCVPFMRVTKFNFTLESALLVIDDTYFGWLQSMRDDMMTITIHPQHQKIVRTNLLERIDNTQQHLKFIADEQQNCGAGQNGQLLELLFEEERESLTLLEAFGQDLREIDPEAYSTLFPSPATQSPSYPSTLLPVPSISKPPHSSSDRAPFQSSIRRALTKRLSIPKIWVTRKRAPPPSSPIISRRRSLGAYSLHFVSYIQPIRVWVSIKIKSVSTRRYST
ncbi:hypothetical protein CVT24_007248 [Panaeolus cyanescens]|uniref:G domain-containing protein n=1 Tax=Panaeolus cyanescens TaxID=181874 RepID=A0A409YWF1_9AGAR|nr:hypothetical protein CVT24_007248 [Panaeolus cyanescens]